MSFTDSGRAVFFQVSLERDKTSPPGPPPGAGWVDVGGDCWHRIVDPATSC
ncbi:MAG: hypothetical protein WCJ30_25045 [Deltaproteobacteria bacterium]